MVIATTFRHGYAVVVGIGADLAATVRDAFGLHELLTDPGRCAYPADQARLLTEGAAGRSGILVALDELADRCAADPEATVIIFYSGHGGHRDGDGTYFLVPHGFRWDDFDRTAITAEDFVAKVRAVRAKRLLVLLDCCHAGSFAEAKNFIKSPPPPEAIEQLSRGEGRAVVASSRAGELSYAGTPYSIFTAALLEGLAGYGSSRRDGYAELFDVLVWIRDQVPCRSGGKQNPILSSDSLTLSFPLALYAGGQDHPKPLEWSSSRLDLGGSTGGAVVRNDNSRIVDGLRKLNKGQFRTIVTRLNISNSDVEGDSQTERANSLLELASQVKKLGELHGQIESFLPGWFRGGPTGP